MLMDHVTKTAIAVTHKEWGSFWTLPAQAFGAPLFYFLPGADGRKAVPLRSTLVLLGTYVLLLEAGHTVGIDTLRFIHPHTLLTIALVRPLVGCLAKIESSCGRLANMVHGGLAVACVLLVDPLANEGGLQLGYGARSLLWAAGGRLRCLGEQGAAAAGRTTTASSSSQAVYYELAALCLHLTMLEITQLRPFRESDLPGMLYVTVLMWILVFFFAFWRTRYRFRRITSGSVFVDRVTWLLAHRSIWIYSGHLFLLAVLVGAGVLRGPPDDFT